MITWDARKQKFTWTDRSNFLPDTRIQVQEFQHHITQPYPFNLPSNASPMDQYVSTKPITSKRVPSGTNLCHHISIGAIQEVTCAYLNGEISIWVFMNFVGNVATPTWLTLLDKNSSGIVLKEWAYSFVNKISIAVNTKLSNKTPQEIANIANNFCEKLNNMHVNLRYGDSTTNKSISDHLDARLARGFTVDPITWVEHVWGYCIGRPVFASESSAFINVGYNRYLPSNRINTEVAVRAPDTVAMSESDVTVAATQSRGNPIMGANKPYASMLRGNIPGLTYSPIDRSTLILAFGVYFLLSFLMSWL
jgi:hypothetical protein